MQEVVSSIRRVTDIVGEISSASQEQNAGVGQVAEAVSHMDQATQQNAALVEESAAAAASLRVQADQLLKAVAVFRLSHGGGGATLAYSASSASGTSSVAKLPPLSAPPKPASHPRLTMSKPAEAAGSKPASSTASRSKPAKSPTRPASSESVVVTPSIAKGGGEGDWESF
jgi:methyl-accepting chemotaxis protein